MIPSFHLVTLEIVLANSSCVEREKKDTTSNTSPTAGWSLPTACPVYGLGLYRDTAAGIVSLVCYMQSTAHVRQAFEPLEHPVQFWEPV